MEGVYQSIYREGTIRETMVVLLLMVPGFRKTMWKVSLHVIEENIMPSKILTIHLANPSPSSSIFCSI